MSDYILEIHGLNKHFGPTYANKNEIGRASCRERV